jgi:elongation factor G
VTAMSLPIANGGVPGIQQLSIEKTRMSENPIVAFAIEPRTVIDRERLDSALKRFVGEDPALRVRTDGETKQVIVAGTSERQLESVIARLTGECDVESTIGALRVIYKETFTRAADGEGKFTRQSGGRGQYAHAKIHLYPGESGGGYVFKNAMYSGSIPAKFIGPTEHGIREALARRSIVRSGFEDLIDVMVELYDGSYHDVDSSALAFETAGGMAVEDASAKARAVLQEPFMHVDVVVPSDRVGDVMEDLSKRRGRIQSVETGGEACFISARIPLSTSIGYEGDLRSRTGERGTCSIKFDGYEPCMVQPDIDDGDRLSSVRMPRFPTPKLDDSSIRLPEPDEDRD